MADDDDKLRQFLPLGFGKQTKTFDFEFQYENAQRQDYKDRSIKKEQTDETESDSDGDELEDLPISHEIILREHSKTVSALDIDPAGMRIASGSHDYNMDLWDLGGMNMAALHPFRSVEPLEAHPVRALQYSNTGEHILVVPSSNQAKLFTKDGVEEAEYVRGDMYIQDMNKTSGHVAEITCAKWNPADGELFATSSLDSTVRIWDANVRRTHRNVMVVRSKSAKQAKARLSTLAWAPSGTHIAAATTDGGIMYWPTAGPYSRPAGAIADAHQPDSWTSGLSFGQDGTTLVSRGGDGTVKLWDTRNFKRPILSRFGLVNTAQETSIGFNPDNRYIITGTSSTPDAPIGQLHILDKSDLSTVIALTPDPDKPCSVVSSVWHPKLNQIVVGTSSGAIHVLFSRTHSSRGAKLVVEKPPKKRHVDDELTADIDLAAAAVTPEELAAAGGRDPTRMSATQRQRMLRKDPAKSRRPDMPVARRMDGEIRVFNFDDDDEDSREAKRKKMGLDI
ncbi:WD40-repeat-containing domain protein [Lipomyces arxii]|uniref:WD40-repeat-containing domain protein n=1 Tax=Lipomyces arxii TaxID=56418 RepID=UPI0034CF2D37